MGVSVMLVLAHQMLLKEENTKIAPGVFYATMHSINFEWSDFKVKISKRNNIKPISTFGMQIILSYSSIYIRHFWLA
jgi:hypothetical protein